MATVTVAQLVAPQQMGASDAAFYTAPLATQGKIGRAIFCNTDTTAHQITVNLVAAGGTSTAMNMLISTYSIAAGDTYVSPELAGLVIPPGSMLRGLADTGAKVTIEVSGVTIV